MFLSCECLIPQEMMENSGILYVLLQWNSLICLYFFFAGIVHILLE